MRGGSNPAKLAWRYVKLCGPSSTDQIPGDSVKKLKFRITEPPFFGVHAEETLPANAGISHEAIEKLEIIDPQGLAKKVWAHFPA